MKNKTLLLFCLLAAQACFGQAVVINGYLNAADPRDEWIELFVVTDNTDMRNWSIRDDNGTQTSWQAQVNFNNIAFWNNMRAGTIIMLWHRPIQSNGVTAHPIDVNKDDGYIEVDATNTTYFNGGAFGTSPTWAGNSLNIAGGGDVIQLRNAAGTHVHALGHISTPGSDWTALPAPKLNHSNTANSGDAIYVCPGAALSDFGTSTPQSGTSWTAKNNSTITFGLPNTCGASASGNANYWLATREPQMSAQVVTPTTVVPGTPGMLDFSWTGATDPNPSDNTTGYLVLRNTSNSFTAPSDGTTYTVGASLGGATVMALITPSTTTSYTDNTVMNGNAYFYRVYAYRYTTDNLNGNSFNTARGTAYNTTNFVQVNFSTPLPIELTGFSAVRNDQLVDLHWRTATETNNAYFTIERMPGYGAFGEIIRIAGAGNSDATLNYSAVDEQPLPGTSYYRLCQTDFNGERTCFTPVAVSFTENSSSQLEIQSFGNSEENAWLQVNVPDHHNLHIDVTDLSGRRVYATELGDRSGVNTLTVPVGGWPQGIYLVQVSDGVSRVTLKLPR